MKFTSVLVANRGEIALRVMRACKELGLRTVAVYSEPDRDAPHVAYADAAYLLGPEPAPGAGVPRPYLDMDRIIAVAQQAGAGAIHPGYGFLSENAAFAEACEEAGLVFIGPPADAMRRMGGKTAARQEAQAAGVPIVPGTLEPVPHAAKVRALGEVYGYPIAIKAVGGGGGRGLRVVQAAADAEAAFDAARREAEAAFGNPLLYVEKYFTDPRHIEVQVLADMHGAVVALGERDCSVQRRHQKLIEECPAPGLSPEQRRAMGEAAVALCHQVGYVGAGTLEFMYEGGAFYFLEMNTRIQVEHTVTEMVTGIDLVQAQIRVAQGEPLWFGQADVRWSGHAIQCRINAEDPAHQFRPALGTIGAYREPAGFGVRVDSGVGAGHRIPPHYDSLLAKLVVWAESREAALARMRRALADFTIEGVRTVLPFHQLALAHPAFAAGGVSVHFIPRHLGAQLAALEHHGQASLPDQEDDAQPRLFDVEVNGRRFAVRVNERGGQQHVARPARKARSTRAAVDAKSIASPIQGTVVRALCVVGQEVEAGQVLFVVEAMKMENEVQAPQSGVIGEVLAQPGQIVNAGAALATFQ
ncbi:acetyl-CoA carboxylase biotin carboxylase subunit [Chloroflexia bacterium SDU3-3]|nr:acetyl-CoA carboxylase biotin carboxylase subunit [Chloroflexia bacterium SDU3-3]